jgi:outer membrane protein OmpA-like peptidoglycan-associated protein
MNTRRNVAVLAAASLLCAAWPVLASESTLVLVLGGEAYDGAPEFEVSFEGTPLGTGIVETAIDTETGGRIADVADKSPYVQSFEFTIPEDVFRPDGELRIKFTNEAYGGEGSNRDRNLYLVSATVNGRVVLGPGFKTISAQGEEPNQLVGDLLGLFDNGEEGVSSAPDGGWPEPVADGIQTVALETAAVTSDDAAAVASDEPAIGPTGGPLILEPEAAAAVEEVKDAAHTVDLAEGERIEVAALGNNRVATVTDCGLDQVYNVVGFNENSNDLTPKLTERLDQIIADIGDEKCTVQITGYSSTQGAYATNALFAIERAQNVLAYLRQAGLEFEDVTATGAGETEQFGETFSANRRVVITVGQ